MTLRPLMLPILFCACPGATVDPIDAGGRDAGALDAGGKDAEVIDTGEPGLENRQPSVSGLDRSGTFLYVGERSPSAITHFRIGADGTLSEVATTPIDLRPFAIASNRTDTASSLYVGATDNTNGAIYQFSVAGDGRLTPLEPATPPSTPQPLALVVDALDQHLWAIDHNDGIRHFNIGAGGALTQNGDDFSNGSQLFAAVIRPPAERLLFVTAGQGPGVVPLAIDGAGRLSKGGPSDGFGQGMSMHPQGVALYVNVQAGLSTYKIAADGALTKADNDQTFAAFSWRSALTPDGGYLYAIGIGQGDDEIFQFAVAADGTLTPLNPASFPLGRSTSDLTIDRDGAHLYVPNATEGTISQLRINADGTLSPLSPLTVRG